MALAETGWLVTGFGVAALLLAERGGLARLRAVAKPVASLGFLIAALGFGALGSSYGAIVLAGLVLGALGDVLLLGAGKPFFVAGLVSFLLGHLAYAFAFARLPLSVAHGAAAALVLAVVLAIVGRWIWPHAPEMRAPIGVYMAVIAAMCAAAIAAGGAGAPAAIPAGAVLFAISDLSVVRDRFISPGFANRAWGLPLYYLAQLLIASSVAGVTARGAVVAAMAEALIAGRA